jgi:hypothetical protein
MANWKLRLFKRLCELKEALNESLTVDARVRKAGLLRNDVVRCEVDQGILCTAKTTQLSGCEEVWQW